MWIASIVIKHDCLIGNKCEQYKVSTISVPFNLWVEGSTTYSPEFHTLWGEDKSIKRFIAALRRDKHLEKIEVDGNKVFLIEVTKRTLPVTIRRNLQQKIIWTKPIHINSKGEERWEIASWDKKHITDFIAHAVEAPGHLLHAPAAEALAQAEGGGHARDAGGLL
jgi:hypothetical protein